MLLSKIAIAANTNPLDTRSMPADFKDEVQAVHDFISETQTSPDSFRSFHWMISTGDGQRVADSSAISGGPVDMSHGLSRSAPFALVFGAMAKMLSLPHIFAVDMPLSYSMVRPRDVLAEFNREIPDDLLAVVASGRRLREPIGWSLNMVFVGLDNANAFVSLNRALLATQKPLRGERLHSHQCVPI